jgi:cell division protein FtsB
LASQTDAIREFILEVVGQALGEFREMLIDDMSETYRDTFAKLSTSVDELRAQVSKLNNGKETAEPIDLPNPIAARRLQ